MAISYPVGPASVPATLTEPPATYRHRVWLALGGLLLFVLLYALLTGWLGWTSYRLLNAARQGGDAAFWGGIVGVCAAFLTVFMVKGLFFMKHGRTDDGELEVKPAEQPQLFVFLHKLADDAGAPRPHRVFLSPRVNASVSYDLSLLNLLVPSKKNLEIGLGLVNVLSLGELKAVLAHEFGHFAQRSMAVGRWVYVAQQIAAHIVARRDKLDEIVARLSRIDLRVAWIGWVLSLVIWSIRSLVDTLFLLVLRMQRALSREMEMHADLVAVSLTGSDTLMYALHRLRTADDAWDRTVAFAGSELGHGRAITDLFAVQSRIIDRMASLLDDETYRSAPPLPSTRPDRFRLFKPELAQPPRMWSTHPANDEREANAKRVYIPAPTDDRSGWLLFANPQQLRVKVSAMVLGKHEKVVPMDTDASIRTLDEQFGRECLDRRYRGIYLDRSVVRPAKRPANLYAASLDGALDHLTALYPESLSRDLERLRTVENEKGLLKAVVNGVFEAPGGVVRHRGKELRPRELPQVITQLEEEASRLQQKLWAYDRRCRTAHRAAAARLGRGWEEYLCGLGAAVHYADHTEANIRDARQALANRVAIATAGGRVGKSDVSRVVQAAQELYAVLEPVFAQKAHVVLDPTLTERMGITSWHELFEEFKLGTPAPENIGGWLDVVDGWTDGATGPLGALRRAALDQLLAAEAQVAQWMADGAEPAQAPPASRVPADYAVLLPGGERELQHKLPWFKRFQAADGVVPATARFLAAASIIGAVLGFGGKIGEASVAIYNGLGRPVTVTAGEKVMRVEAFGHASVSLPPGVYQVRTTTIAGKTIELFDATVERSFGTYVYNVAGAASLVEWTQVYGKSTARPPHPLGAPRWTETEATTLFTDPPNSISSKGGGGRILVLSGFASGSPSQVLDEVEGARAQSAVIAAHARWDVPSRRYAVLWLRMASDLPNFPAILAARLAENPNDMLALRARQDVATGAARDSVCARDREVAGAAPDDANLQYLTARCIPDEGERNRAFATLSERWPRNGWLAFATGMTHSEEARWEEALSRLEIARADAALSAVVADDVARLRRMVTGVDADLADVRSASEELEFRVSLETGDGWEQSPYRGYTELAHGRLKAALQRAGSLPSLQTHLLPLVAASDGADPSWADSALASAPDTAIGTYSAWALLALAARGERDLTPYSTLAKQGLGDRADHLLRFIDVLRTKRDPAAAELSLGSVSLRERGIAYSVGTVILGSAAPATWREGAKRLLFASERPYFQ
jgi:Zn-dependent protease with chaperone function